MPFDSMVVAGSVVLMFASFGAIIAWAELQRRA